MATESATSLSRKAGYKINNPSTGFVFQSSLSLISRALSFMFMPLLGFLADKNDLIQSHFHLLILYWILPISLFFVCFFRSKIEFIFSVLLYRMDKEGSFFKKTDISKLPTVKTRCDKPLRKYKKFKKLYNIFLLSYIPFYLSWPVIIVLLQEFNEYRGTILGLSSVFNGINTILITIFIDPKLTQLGNYSKLIQVIYLDLVLLRLIASIIGFFVLVVFLFWF